MNNWKPIESAPENEWILVHYAKEITDKNPNWHWKSYYSRTHVAMIADGEWIDSAHIDIVKPTHWQPKPEDL